MKKLLLLLALTLITPLATTHAAQCMNPSDQDFTTGTCLNYLGDTMRQDTTERVSITDISYDKGIISTEVCNESTRSFFHPEMYLQIDVPGFPSYWKKLENETFHAQECRDLEFALTDRIPPRYYLVTAALRTELPNATQISHTMAKASNWTKVGAPLRSLSGKRYNHYPVHANERVPHKFPFQQSNTHLRRGVYYPGNVWLFRQKNAKSNLTFFQRQYYPTVGLTEYRGGDFLLTDF